MNTTPTSQTDLAGGGPALGFRLLDTGPAPAAWNMALDETLLAQAGSEAQGPTVRFYAWDRPTLSIGYFQRAQAELDFEEIRRRGYGFVRRMTGGRAVLHDAELTYSVVLPGSHPAARASVTESFRMLSAGLQEGFARLGVRAEMVSLEDGRPRGKPDAPGSAACFDSASWYELEVGRRKIAGSAQVRAHGGLLQHGSLLLDLRPEDLFAVMRLRSERLRQKAQNEFRARATSAKEHLGREVPYSEAVLAFAKGFSAIFGGELEWGRLSEREIAAADALAAQKYASDEWNFRR